MREREGEFRGRTGVACSRGCVEGLKKLVEVTVGIVGKAKREGEEGEWVNDIEGE